MAHEGDSIHWIKSHCYHPTHVKVGDLVIFMQESISPLTLTRDIKSAKGSAKP